MKTTRWVLGAVIVGGLLTLGGCTQGEYQIPAVEPVVKPKPEDDLLADISGGDTAPKAAPAPSAAPPEPKPAEEPKPAPEAAPAKAEPAKPAPAAPAAKAAAPAVPKK